MTARPLLLSTMRTRVRYLAISLLFGRLLATVQVQGCRTSRQRSRASFEMMRAQRRAGWMARGAWSMAKGVARRREQQLPTLVTPLPPPPSCVPQLSPDAPNPVVVHRCVRRATGHALRCWRIYVGPRHTLTPAQIKITLTVPESSLASCSPCPLMSPSSPRSLRNLPTRASRVRALFDASLFQVRHETLRPRSQVEHP